MGNRLWTRDDYGEPWLDNPQLLIAGNPLKRRKKKVMAKRAMPAGLRRYWAKHRRKPRRARKNAYFVNPHRRRRVRARVRHRRRAARRPRQNAYFLNPRRRRGRRRYRSNPSLMGLGFQLPNLMDVAAVGAGMVVPPIVASYVMGWIPDAWKTSKAAYYVVKAASVVIPSMLVRKFVSQRAGNLMLLGGAVSFALDLVKEFAPGVIPGLGYQPLLGAVVQRNFRVLPRTNSGPALAPIIAMTPDRLSPQGRF